MKKIYTPEQKEQKKATRAEWMANRSPEKVAADKAKAKIAQAKSLANRTPEKVEENKAQNKITLALRRANRSTERIAEDKVKHALATAKWNKANPNKVKASNAKFKESNPDYRVPCMAEADLGYYAVYLIENYNSSGDHYCGQTGNLYNRMTHHRHCGKLNTENHRILQCFETREQAMAFEAIQHEAGYHGYNNGN